MPTSSSGTKAATMAAMRRHFCGRGRPNHGRQANHNQVRENVVIYVAKVAIACKLMPHTTQESSSKARLAVMLPEASTSARTEPRASYV